MNHFTIYDLSTGEVKRNILAVNAEQAQLQVEENEGIVPMKLDTMMHYVNGGRVMTYTSDEQERKKVKPSPYHVWNQRRRRYEDSRSVQEISARRKQGILDRMAGLERSQGRTMREAVLSGDHTRLQALNDTMEALRQQLNQS
jgi:hypothetical protein